MGNFVGIDLGTTFSAISYIDETGRPKIIPNSDGKNITPSVVAEKEGKLEVGTDYSVKTWSVNPKMAASRFKREMSNQSKLYKIGKKEYSPAELSSFILKKLVQDSSEIIDEIEEVVVTIPANFANEAREATMQASKLAGLDVNYIINEPTSAALYYAFNKGQELSGNYAVYDLGGGTFDISIIKVVGQDIEIISSNGIEKCGGDDFDKAIFEIASEKYTEATGKEIDATQFSLVDAEEEKKALSSRDKTLAQVGDELIQITKEEFENKIKPLVLQARLLCESTLEESGLNSEDIKEVFLSGGSTRIPLVRSSISEVFGKEPTSTINVDEVVALGASLYAAYKGDRSKLGAAAKASIDQISVKEATSKCFGTLFMEFDEMVNAWGKKNAVLIERGDKIPTSITQTFFTMADYQESIELEVTESVSKEEDPRFVKIIWEGNLQLKNPDSVRRGDEVKVTFSYDDNQIMNCKFQYKDEEFVEVDLSMVEKNESDEISNIEIV